MSLERKRGEWTSATMPQEGRRGALILIDSELAVDEVATAMMQYRWKALGSGVQQWRELVEDSGKSDEHGNWYRKVYTLVVHLVLYTLVVYIGSTVNEEGAADAKIHHLLVCVSYCEKRIYPHILN